MTHYDRWKLDSPDEYKPKADDPACDECNEQFPEEYSTLFLKNGLCEKCGEHECEECGERLLAEDAIPFNDSAVDGIAQFCKPCAEDVLYVPI